MGMYDEIVCRHPLPGTPPAFVRDGHRFHSKDLECILAVYEITTDGRLCYAGETDHWSSRLSDDELAGFHGTIDFYTSNWSAIGYGHTFTPGGEDFEDVRYRAYFTNGTLDRLDEVWRGVEPAKPMSEYNAIRDAAVAKKRAEDGEKNQGAGI